VSLLALQSDVTAEAARETPADRIPCALPASGRATWWNSSKTASWSASGIPGPSSLAVATVQYRGAVIDSEQRDVALRLTPYTSALGNVVSARVGIVTGLQQFVAVTLPSGPSTDSFRPFAAGLYSGAPGVRAIQVARGDIIEFMHPVTGNEAAIGLSLLTDPRAAVRANAARDHYSTPRRRRTHRPTRADYRPIRAATSSPAAVLPEVRSAMLSNAAARSGGKGSVKASRSLVTGCSNAME